MTPRISHTVYEEKLQTATWEDELREGDSLVGPIELVAPVGLNVGTSGGRAPILDSPMVGIWLMPGSTPDRYVLKVRCPTAFGEKLEGDISVLILP